MGRGSGREGARGRADSAGGSGRFAVRVCEEGIGESRGWGGEGRWAKQEETVGPVMTSQDAREGAAAFAQKRAPNWTGK